MAAPRLTFDKEEEKKKKKGTPPPPKKKGGFFSDVWGGVEDATSSGVIELLLGDDDKKKTPPPPARIRDPKKQSWQSNFWSGIQSIPRMAFEEEEKYRHAIAKDITTAHGIVGLTALPARLTVQATEYAITGDKKELAKLKRLAKEPWRDRKPGEEISAFNTAAEQTLEETYETTRRATGTRGREKFGEIWHDNPVAALGSVAIFVPPVARVAGITKMSGSIRAANEVPTKDGGTRKMTRTEATKAATVESYYPGTLDKLGIEGSPFKPRFSGRRVSRSTTGRASQKAFDWASEKIDEGIGVGTKKTGPDTLLSKTRREAAGKRRADDLQRARLVTDAMRHVFTFRDYLNDTQVARVGTALGRRKDTLNSRDAAVGVALHASSAIDPVEAVRHGAEDTKAILQSGKRDAHDGDIADVEEGKRLGQIVWVTHGRDEDGKPIREQATVTADNNGQVTVATPEGDKTIPHNQAHLLGPNGEGEIPLNADEIKMLERRYDLLTDAHDELLAEPRLQEKFRAAVQTMTDLGQKSELLGEEFFTRGMEPTGAEAMATLERLTARRNQFVPRLGGEGVEPIDYTAGLWGDLMATMDKASKLTDDQKLYVLQIFDHQARVWANEVEGRNPADYLSSPEGARIGGIDFSQPEDLEATLNAMFQTEGDRNNLVTTSTTALVLATPQVGNVVSTPKGMGRVTGIETDENGARIAWVEMHEGATYSESFPTRDLRVSEFPWIGHPQPNDYVQTPDGPGRLISSSEGPGPSFITTYRVEVFDEEGGHFVPGEEKMFQMGQVQRIEDPRQSAKIFHLTSQQALADPKFPKKATVEQYRKAFEKAGVKAEEFYWMRLSRFPTLEGELASAEAVLAQVKKKIAEDPDQLFRYRGPGERNKRSISAEEMLAIRQAERDAAKTRLDDYTEEPDESFVLDADYGGKSFSVQAIEDAIKANVHFLNLKETLYSSKASYEFRDRWGMESSESGLIIRDPTDDEPYYELVISLPDSDLFTTGHYPRRGKESHLLHLRFHLIRDNEGHLAVLGDEFQSDWGNQGRTQGFKEILSPRDQARAAKQRDRERRFTELRDKAETELGFGESQIFAWYERQIQDKADEMNAEIEARNEAKRERMLEAQGRGEDTTGPEYAREARLSTYGSDHQIIGDRLVEDNANDPIFQDLLKQKQRFERINTKRRDARVAADAIETGGGRAGALNRGPFVMSDAVKYLAFKRLVRFAADHGADRIIWVRGKVQGVRYSKYNDLPIEYHRDNSHLDPDDYGSDFYYQTGSTTIYIGRHYRSSEVPEEKLYRMQQAQPIEVKFDDLEEYGDTFVLLPNGHPNDVPSGVPGQMSLLGEPDIPPANVARHERWARVVSETDDGVVVQPVDPKWDPAIFEVDFRGERGDNSYGSWDIRIVNRVGETIYSDTVDGSFDGIGEVLDAVQEDWERTLRNWSPSGQAIEITNENATKMHQLIEILKESDTATSEFDYMVRNAESELDQDAWDEYVANYEGDSDYEIGGSGNFDEIHGWEARGLRRVRELTEEVASLERKQQEDIERGQISRDYKTEIRDTKLALEIAKENVENKEHDAGYDDMNPLAAKGVLKPYRKEPDATPVEIKPRIFRGRFAVSGRGVVSEEGDLDGWVMDLPKKMLDDAKGTQSLFQKGNDIIKGASTWVGGPEGQRFISLTEHADFSTLMHEFIGHATEEMKRRYPELWQAVEVDMKKPLEKWTKADHEKFAKYVERYWMEGKPPSPELATVMRMVKEWMKGVYSSITQLGKPMPDSTRILLNRHLGQGVTARPGARTYVPHISQFDTMMDTAPGGTRLSAGDNVIGRNMPDRRNFGARRNRGILWQSGELALSARPIIDQYFRRTKFLETESLRQEMYDEGHPMPRNGRAPEGAWLIRNPQTAPEKLTARNKSKLSEEDFSRMIGEGDTPDEFVTKMEEIRKDHYAEPGEHPDWANDLENVRWIEAGKVTQRIANVFPSAPRGRGAATVGSLNSLARLTGIYLRPLHYLVGNIPQNVMMVALTNPGTLVNSVKYGAYSFLPRVVREVGMQPRDLFAHDRHLYNQIKTETGDIQAGAGLPDFYTMANNTFQKAERRLNRISQGSAEKLGELADQPYRVSVWMGHAKGYGYNTPDEWRALLDSERGTPEARIRDDIAQKTREDMIDFNTLNPWERQNISRFFYLWAFTRGFAKWPVTFAREYPGRAGFAMTLADPQATDDNGLPLRWLPSSGTVKTNQGPGKIRDLGFLDPTGGFRQQIETGIQVAHGNISGIGGMATPPLETIIQAGIGGPRAPKGGLRGFADQIARDTVPFYDIGRRTTTPGVSGWGRLERFLDFHDRFGVKAEIGKGKNAEKKRKEDEKIRRAVTGIGRSEMLPQVMHQQDAYWHHKYLEQQIRFGDQARRKGTALTDEQKTTILYATAADYFPEAELPKLTEVLKESAAYQERLRREMSDGMFGLRNQAVAA